MNIKPLATLALVGLLSAGAAQAGNRADLQWSLTIASPQLGVVVGVPVYAPRVHVPQVYAPQVVVVPRRAVHRAAWRDDDRDGIPNRYDRVYNPRWDRDGDGVPNRYDRRDNRRDDRRDDRREGSRHGR